ncbi:cupin domain-containing protein, partial [Mycobacteroides abscessus]|uniref:cupin domain-containing protein n=1 Tax=Mycobacteroides abscessus TaxID=36809 RepID=UPI0009A5E8A9
MQDQETVVFERDSASHVHGSLPADAKWLGRRGWVIGAFFDSPDIRLCTDLEVKYGEFLKGVDPKHPAKVSATTEFTYILSGRVRAVVGSDVFILSEGEYVLIHPGAPNNT